MHRRAIVLVLLLLLAGCAGRTAPRPTPTPEPLPEVPPLVIDHDHRDGSLHQSVVGFTFRGFVDAATIVGDEPARFSDIQFYGNRSAVTINGRGGGSSGGFALFDLGNEGLTFLGRYRSGSEDNWYTKFTPTGRYVLLTANGASSPGQIVNGTLQTARSAAAAGGARGIHIVDVRNPAAPALVGFYPAPVRVINLATWPGRDGHTYVAASMVQDRLATRLPTMDSKDLNFVSIFRLVGDDRAARLEEISRWQPQDAAGILDAFPHDLTISVNPFNGRHHLYVAYWDAGAYVVDVSDPTQPLQISRVKSTGPEDHAHTYKPHPTLLDGRLYAVVAPETFAGEAAGAFRVVDLTEMRSPRAVATWSPPPAPKNAEALLFSPHEFSLAEGRVFASNFHGGLWQLRLPDLVPEARWDKSLGNPARTNDWAVDVASAYHHGNLVYAVDMNAGIITLEPYRAPSPSLFI